MQKKAFKKEKTSRRRRRRRRLGVGNKSSIYFTN